MATAGSKADVPKDLLAQIQHLEEIFTVDTKKLKEITNHFVSELAKGMFYSTGPSRLVLRYGRLTSKPRSYRRGG
jgi:hexokinase